MKYFLLSIFSVIAVSVFGQLNGDGFYRVKNVKTLRYIYVNDNTGKINVSTASADMGAIMLWKDQTKAIKDPASVLYIKTVGSNGNGALYDITAQGTGIHQIINYYINIYKSSYGYQVYAEGYYLDDEETSSVPDGQLGTNRSGAYRYWTIEPVEMNKNYVAVEPTLKVNGKYYLPYYASFGYSFYSSGMKAYYVSRIQDGKAVLSEIKTAVIPQGVPVILECSSDDYTQNKLTPKVSTEGTPTTNMLKGVYFFNEDRASSAAALTKYNASTMRVLGLTSKGTLGYVTGNDELCNLSEYDDDGTLYLKANQSYLVVPKGTPAELEVIKEEDMNPINSVKVTQDISIAPVYNTNGVKVAEGKDAIQSLPKGIYIVDGKKIWKP